ncbi:hypothetical protein FACS1894137_05990 [Spirochaetia bacterium]|nr:hypothetical protein FACS1894137_05990 [Spirochaetia bacterium]
MGDLELKLSEEFNNIDFNSKRLNERFQQTVMTFGKRLGGAIYASSESRAEAKAIYRMLGNTRLDSEKIAQVHKTETIRRIAGYGDVILAVQDTTGIN